MRVPLEWLHEYCRPALETPALAERLAMTGTVVERVERHGVAALEHFVVGRVLQAGRHPDADRLSVCLVDVGDDVPSQIVCGAPNVAAGQTVAVAKPGAVMPDGAILRVAKLRGIESRGMILAEDELAIGTDHDRTIVLKNGDGGLAPGLAGGLAPGLAPRLEPGTPLHRVLPIATDVLVLEITPNRPDCLGIYGVAREVHAATQAPLERPPWADDPGTEGALDEAAVIVECPDLCSRFTARVFENVRIVASPPWLKARLMAAGQRPISNVVDITNYVMLLTGQPLHAFDLDRIAGGTLTVRQAHDGEPVATLDGQTRTLDKDMVLIADADGPTSIAGVMGGARSEVADDTTRVLMEAANWDGPNIHRTAQKLGLRSEASGRFEKGLQPEQALEAQAVAARLMIDLCGATLSPGTIDVGGPGPEPPTIRLRDARVIGLLGAPIPRERSAAILSALEFAVADADDGLDVTVPAFRRADVTREVDVIEEIARLGALDELPATLPSRHGAAGRLTGIQRLRRRAADALTAQGLHEIVGWSFVAPDLAERLRLREPNNDRRQAVELENPMSFDQSLLRTTLLGSLLDAAHRNRARGMDNVQLFESGAVYVAREGQRLPREPHHIGALLVGAVRLPTWRDPAPTAADFFAAKGVLAGLLDALRVPWTVERGELPFLHPGRAASVEIGGRDAGWLGEIHPLVAAGWELVQTVAAFELDLDAVAEHASTVTLYEDVTSYPELREDLAVIVSAQVSAAQVISTVTRAGEPLLARAEVFDVYRDDERLGEGNVSLALRLVFRARDRTLTDEDVAAKRRAITDALAQGLGGKVRAA